MKYFYYLKDNESQGPFSLDELKSHIITATTLVWTEGLEDWAPASGVAELHPILIASPPQHQKTDAPTPNKKTAEIEDAQKPILIAKSSQMELSVAGSVANKEQKIKVKTPFKPFAKANFTQINNVRIDESFGFVTKNSTELLSTDDLSNVSSLISRYLKLDQIIKEFKSLKNEGKEIWPLAYQLEEFNDFKIEKIREEIANDALRMINARFLRNIVIFVFMVVFSFFSILLVSKYTGFYGHVVFINHILLLPLSYSLLVVFLSFNIKRKIKTNLISNLNMKTAKNILFARTTLQSIYLLIVTIIVSVMMVTHM